ncbi:ThiF family adenylyltransferase [bacterium]|nr:ThiF family adenylyltransferase [bacterium]
MNPDFWKESFCLQENAPPLTDRFQRQAALVPQEMLSRHAITVIGVGAIGRQVALQLAAIGAQSLMLIDPDVVEETNITTQGYGLSDLGQSKVAATAAALRELQPDLSLTLIAERYRPALANSDVVFVCVDTISVRAAIWRTMQRHYQFWADGRMRGDVLRILTATDETSGRHYATTLFPQGEAQVGSCTAQSTIYAASIAAGLMVHQFTRWLRSLPLDADLAVNLLGSELSVADPVTR